MVKIFTAGFLFAQRFLPIYLKIGLKLIPILAFIHTTDNKHDKSDLKLTRCIDLNLDSEIPVCHMITQERCKINIGLCIELYI